MPVLNFDSIQVGSNGLDFTGSQTWTIAAGVTCSSETGFGVYDNLWSNSKLINLGTVVSDAANAVQMDGSSATVVNASSGVIAGANGIVMSSSSATVTNHGSVIGFDGVGVAMSGSDCNLTNTGEITGSTYGITLDAVGGGPNTISNSGFVSGDDLAVRINSDALTYINNSGTMTATHGFGNIVQQVGTGQVFIHNTGFMKGALLGVGDDGLTNDGEIAVVALGGGADGYFGNGSKVGCFVYGEAGEDSLTGGVYDDTFDGGTENDTLAGGKGDDALIGGTGKDTLTGGRDDDTLTGNSSKDTFAFKPGFGNDVITDFAAGGGNHDVIQFRHDVFADYADVSAAMAQVGADVLITADGGHTILILNVTVASLVAADFVF